MTTAIDERMQIGYEDVLHPMPANIARDVDLDKFEFVPWKGRILVKRFSKDEETARGIILPSDTQQEKNYGTVIGLPAIGAPTDIAIGDIVMFIPDSPVEVPELGADLVLLDYRDDFEGDILGVFKPKR